jgi:hypothetical protein
MVVKMLIVKKAVSIISVMMTPARTPEMFVNFYPTTQCYNPEDSHLHIHCSESLKS